MAFFDFLKDFNSEKKAVTGAFNATKKKVNQQIDKSPGWSFLRDNVAEPAVNVEKKVVGAGAGLAREWIPKPAVTTGLTLRQAQAESTSGAYQKSVEDFKKLSYEDRKKKIAGDKNLRMSLEKYGITDPTDSNLDNPGKKLEQVAQDSKKPITPEGRLQKAVLGNEPIKSYTERNRGLREAGVNPVFAGVGTGVTVAMDNPIGGAAKTIGKETVEQVAKAGTKEAVEAVLKGKFKDKTISTVSDLLANTSKKKEVKKILSDMSKTEKNIEKAVKSTDVNDIKNSIRGIVDPKSLDQTASTLSKTKDPGIVNTIIDKNRPPDIIHSSARQERPSFISVTKPGTSEKILYRPKSQEEYDTLIEAIDNKSTDSLAGNKNAEGYVPRVTASKPATYLNAGYKEVDRLPQSILDDVEKRSAKTPVDPIVNEWAATLRQQEQGLSGGQLVATEEGKKRVSDHSQFYREFFKENGRKPTKQDYYDEAKRQLDTGKAHPAVQQQYDPEFRSLAATAESATGPTSVGDTIPLNTDKAPSIIPTATGERQYGTYKSAQRATSLTDNTKTAIEDINPQTYKQADANEVAKKARALVDADPTAAKQKLLTVGSEGFQDGAEEVAVSHALIERLSQEGKDADAVQVIEDLAKKNLAAGRQVQMNAMVERLSPTGIQKLAERTTRLAREANPKLGKQEKLIESIKSAIDKADVTDTKSIRKVVEGVAKGEDKTVGEKVAGRISSVVDPKKKKQADQLVEELTKKIKQESLAPKVAERKKPVEILREVFKRDGEAQDAYTEAQNILFEKYKDNPNAMKTLNKYFESELGLPAAGTTIDQAVRDQLKQNSKKISEVIQQSWASQKRSVDDVAKALVSEGFDEKSAKALASEVTDRLNKQVAESKAKALEKMGKNLTVRTKSTEKDYAEKVIKLSNLGALDEADYQSLARKQLKLPELTPELSKELSSLAQKMQEYPTGDPQRYLLAQEIGDKIQAAIPRTKTQLANEIFGAPRAILSSTDISGMGRQGLMLGTRYPKEYVQAFKAQVKFLKDEKFFKDSMAEIATSKNYDIIANKMKVALTGVSKKPEEAFSSTILEGDVAKKLGVGHILAGSDRGYTGALTKFRNDVANKILEDMGPDKVAKMSDQELESLGQWINVATGRGGKPGGWLDKHADTLGQALFSPRLWGARLAPLNPKYYYDLKGPARRKALENAATFMGVAGSVLGIATLLGGEVETDARSSDFLKIKVGDTRYDVLGGFQQNIVFAHRILQNEKKSSTSGAVTTLGENYGGDTRLSLLFDLLGNKSTPVLASGARLLEGKDRSGQPTNIKNELIGLTTPLSVQEVGSSLKKDGIAGAAKTLPNFLGVGTQTYGVKDINVSDKQQQYLDNLKKQKADPARISAVKEYFQLKKTVPKADDTMEEIKKAIEVGDTEKVRTLANNYNTKYSATFKKWGEQYNDKFGSPDIIQDYQDGKIDGKQISRAAAKLKKEAGDKKKGIVRL